MKRDTPAPWSPDPEVVDLAVEVFRILADATRMQLLWLLRSGQLPVGELAARIGKPQALVSQHLAKLRTAHVAKTRRQGNRIHYRLANEHVRQLVEDGLFHAEHIGPGVPEHHRPPQQRPFHARGTIAGGAMNNTHRHHGWLARLKHAVVPHSHDSVETIQTAEEASGLGIRTASVGLAGMMATAVAQVVIVAVSGSIALMADTVHNLGHAATTIPLIITFRLGRRPSNERYTYGYRRAEDLVGAEAVGEVPDRDWTVDGTDTERWRTRPLRQWDRGVR